MADLRGRLGSEQFAAAWASGCALPLAEAVAEAQVAPPPAAQPGDANRPPAASPVPFGLTARELEVLRLVAVGRTDRQIADALFLSPRTVHHHVANLLTKLGAANRSAAVEIAHAAGLQPAPS